MVLINKQPKLSCHVASMPINDRLLIKSVMLICFCSAKFLLGLVSEDVFMKIYLFPIRFVPLRSIKKQYECNTYPLRMEYTFDGYLGRHLVSRELPSGTNLAFSDFVM